MATEKTETTGNTVPVQVPSGMTPEQFMAMMAQFTAQMSQGIAAGINEARPRKVTAGQYDPKTPWQPNKKKALKLTRNTFQNGTWLNPATLNNTEIGLLNRLNRSGRYIGRLIEVLVRQDGSDEVVELRYKNRTTDERMEHRSAYRDLADMLAKIVDEQDKLNEEDGLMKEARKREAFSTKATRDARARVAADELSDEP